MIKEQVKCPKCNKVLLRGYSTAVISVQCRCGAFANLKKPNKDWKDTPTKFIVEGAD